MKRQRTFRGRDITGKWHYGYLFQGKTEDNENYSVILKQMKYVSDDRLSEDLPFAFYKEEVSVVAPNTIGQFTGLKDKNGKEIYEGDILKFFYIPYYSRYDIALKVYRVGEVAFVNGCFRLVNLTDYDDIDLNTKSELQPCEGSEIEIHSNFCSVIGNIHDNPELLEEGEK